MVVPGHRRTVDRADMPVRISEARRRQHRAAASYIIGSAMCKGDAEGVDIVEAIHHFVAASVDDLEPITRSRIDITIPDRPARRRPEALQPEVDIAEQYVRRG